MYVKKDSVVINELNIWFDKTSHEVKWLIILYDKWLFKLFLEGEEVKEFFSIDKLPKTDEDIKKLRKELKEIYETKKITKSTIYGELDNEVFKSDTI